MTHPYASAAYARVFDGVARPLRVEPWGTYVLVRDLPGGQGQDAMGVYPLTAFPPGADLESGLGVLRDAGLVSVGLVPDPATAPPIADLQRAFGLCRAFKTHQLIDYGRQVGFSKHHRYEVKKALSQVSVEIVSLSEHLEAWRRLYAQLSTRHALQGLAAFSDDAFARLAEVEGLTAIAASADGEIVSMHLWAADEERGHATSLLAASSEEGYRRSAAYAVYDAAIGHFSHLRTLNLGSGAGLSDTEDGLARFKRGFANAEATAHFCGAILDSARYAALSGGTTALETPFPAYRFAPAQGG